MVNQPRIKTHWTVEEYLAAERTSEGKSEYIDGMIYDMAGASDAHNAIVSSTHIRIGMQLLNRPCRTWIGDMRLRTPSGLYAYPDLMVVCGDVEVINEEFKDSLLNPTIIVEVLSPSTERFDRGAKFKHYQSLESLQQYALISQDEPLVELFTRQSNGAWLYLAITGLDGACELESVGCTVALKDMYEHVTFS